MRRQFLFPGAALVALLSVDCAVGGTENGAAPLGIDAGAPSAPNPGAGSSGSSSGVLVGSSGGSSDGTGDSDASVNGGGDDGAFVVNGEDDGSGSTSDDAGGFQRIGRRQPWGARRGDATRGRVGVVELRLGLELRKQLGFELREQLGIRLFERRRRHDAPDRLALHERRPRLRLERLRRRHPVDGPRGQHRRHLLVRIRQHALDDVPGPDARVHRLGPR